MPDLFPSAPRRPRRVLMHVCDAGSMSEAAVRFRCSRCGHETDWIDMGTVTAAKKGIPCERCNAADA